jgi:hypothetical protein
VESDHCNTHKKLVRHGEVGLVPHLKLILVKTKGSCWTCKPVLLSLHSYKEFLRISNLICGHGVEAGGYLGGGGDGEGVAL